MVIENKGCSHKVGNTKAKSAPGTIDSSQAQTENKV